MTSMLCASREEGGNEKLEGEGECRRVAKTSKGEWCLNCSQVHDGGRVDNESEGGVVTLVVKFERGNTGMESG